MSLCEQYTSTRRTHSATSWSSWNRTCRSRLRAAMVLSWGDARMQQDYLRPEAAPTRPSPFRGLRSLSPIASASGWAAGDKPPPYGTGDCPHPDPLPEGEGDWRVLPGGEGVSLHPGCSSSRTE